MRRLVAVSTLAACLTGPATARAARPAINGLGRLDPTATFRATYGDTFLAADPEAVPPATFGDAPGGFDPSGAAVTNVGGFTFDVNTFLGAGA
jgi:hypothetical protein